MNELAAKIFENTEYSAILNHRRQLMGLDVWSRSLFLSAKLDSRVSRASTILPIQRAPPDFRSTSLKFGILLCYATDSKLQASKRVFRPTPTAEASDPPVVLYGDPSVFLPPTTDITEADLLMLLYSLTIRIENVGRIMQTSAMRRSPTLNERDELVSALKALDERTLDEVWAMVRRGN
ncbi:hypothetical protein C8J57DRAFT_1255958 [Mycena rebaudengoi]|nr:hypothetical protein C8J57DRAFT_1255958 [Mycena rebaudengoi]